MCTNGQGFIVYCISLETKEGQVVAEKNNPAVSSKLLNKILRWKQTGASEDDCLKRLRLQMVPTGYLIQPWTQGW